MSGSLLLDAGGGGHPGGVARSEFFQEPGAPVAVIEPLPPETSNGTFCYLDGSGSYSPDPDRTIVNYTWEVYFRTGETTQYMYAKNVSFMFSELGLYIITLTVRDSTGLNGTAYTALYSILDSDTDGLPDWWEVYYFSTSYESALRESGSDDSDGDGWTNLQEYANSLDPTYADPHPGLVQDLKESWYYLVAVAAVIAAVLAVLFIKLRKKRREEERKKISAAIEIEKALEED